MGKVELNLVEEICNEQDFDEMLLKITKRRKENGIKRILQKINEDTNIDSENKKQMYEEIFNYIGDINKNVEMDVKKIFICGIKATMKKIEVKKLYDEEYKENEECEIICDLLPNYIEKLTSKTTNEYIENHLQSCEKCKRILEYMSCEIKLENEDDGETILLEELFKRNKQVKCIIFI